MIPAGVLPASVAVAFDGRVVMFCAAAALLVGVLFGIAPAWQVGDLTSARAIASDSRTSTGGGGRLRSVLVVAEVATAVLLLVGAGLLLRTLLAVQNVDRGYRADQILTMVVDPLASRYPTSESLQQFYDEVAREVAAVPGVRGVAWASTPPLGPSYAGQRAVAIVGDAPPDDSQRPLADYQIVSGSYFDTIDLPVVAGRAFSPTDLRESPFVCIVNEAFVRRHLGGRNPIGHRVALTPANAPQQKPVVREIVGVARQVKGRPDETEDLVQVYVPMTQAGLDDTFLLVRPATGDAAALAPAVRAAIGRIDTAQLVSVGTAKTLDDIAREATSSHRFRAVLVAAFAGLALVLAMVGVFGILAYSVQQRTADFAVRRAMGATTNDVLRLVAGSAARVVVAGAAIGLASSIGGDPPADDGAVRRRAARPRHVRVGRGGARRHGGVGDCRAGVAGDANRSRRDAAQQLSAAAGATLAPAEGRRVRRQGRRAVHRRGSVRRMAAFPCAISVRRPPAAIRHAS